MSPTKKPTEVWCPYCGAESEWVDDVIVYGKSYGGKVYLCRTCAAWVGCHKQGKHDKPLGRLANADLRKLKVRCHALFDPIWQQAAKTRGMKARGLAYKWVAEGLGIDWNMCHFGEFDEATCRRAIGFLLHFYESKAIRPPQERKWTPAQER